MASGTLLTQRCPRWAGSAQAAAVFDRICVESFVYHASVMMAFDPCLDVLSDPQRRLGLSRYFSDPVHLPSTSGEPEVVNQPILHTSYEFFLLIADTTKLARIPGPLSNAELAIREDLESQLSQFVPGIMTTRNHAEMLYLYALQIMLMKGYPGIDSKEADRTIITHLQGAMNTLLMVDPEQYFASFLLWPLAIFGAVMVLQDEIQVIRDYLTILQEMRAGGQAKWTLKRLEEIWRGRYHLDTAPDHCTRRWIGLQAFLDGNNRD
ncbi:fungal Zn binuclear cluster domain-containing protein [Penicillium chermesinum]|uniref:Fungal Zn binuclear cluster domain-containing protein n=1 Tax=Penicillium chermesinum TaxID=63820 RepID=A0A9W9NNK0_9EURO|nr:fungal Zn binuclear cluster domain-containing protein [Penicillium chermesinum]KAJ5223259.1 fungal Zn binuclear cluster domain-containing protein [Penicillium chermesinum]